MKNLLPLLALLFSFGIHAQTFDKIKLDGTEIPKGYTLTDKPMCISIQACTFYDSPQIFEAIIGKIKSKDVQNFENKKDGGSILYFEFENQFERESFLKGFIWGGKKATSEHPEQIFVKDKILIIYSFPLKSPIIEVSQKKVKSELK